MAARGYGRGTVFQRKSDGRWMARVTMRGERVVQFSATTEADVTDKLDAWLTKHRPDRMAPHVPRTRMPREDYMIAARAIASHTDVEWRMYLATTGGLCHYCKRKVGLHPHKDHRTPVCRGGSDGIDNVVLACADCNMRKGAMTEAEFVEFATEIGFFDRPRTRAIRRRLKADL